MLPIAGVASKARIADALSALLLITVTWCPFPTNNSVSSFSMFPKEPVITIFIS